MNRSRWLLLFSSFSMFLVMLFTGSGLIPGTAQAKSKPIEVLVYQNPG